MTDMEGWPWRPDLCPADLRFGEWVEAVNADMPITSILHVGTGLHHHVGLLLAGRGRAVVGLTISDSEFGAWLHMDRSPDAYMVRLRDIRDRGYERAGPRFDVMTLFHLAETPPEDGQRSDLEVIQFACVLANHVAFYPGSYGYPKIADDVRRLERSGRLERYCAFRGIDVYRVRS